MGEFPAKQTIEDLNIVNQSDPKVQEATNLVYKKEFHQGVLNENTGKFKGRKVSDAKPLVEKELRESGLSDSMYKTSRKSGVQMSHRVSGKDSRRSVVPEVPGSRVEEARSRMC